MFLYEFRSFTWLHGLSLLVCAAAFILFAWHCRRARGTPGEPLLRSLVVCGCFLTWLGSAAYWAMPERFAWHQGLPLHYCNLANVLGGLAVLTGRRRFQAVLYFWSLALCNWAFLTPTLFEGPALFGYWIFWLYHAFIGFALIFVLVVDRFVPDRRDLVWAIAFTLAYSVCLAVLDYHTGWNYGFVGPSKPGAPTLIDHLGPYPLRLVWMSLIAMGLFTLLLLPWWFVRPRAGELQRTLIP